MGLPISKSWRKSTQSAVGGNVGEFGRGTRMWGVPGLSCVAAGALAIALSACGIDEPLALGEKPRILYVGDSIAANTYATVESLTEARGATLHATIYAGTTLCDFLDDKPVVDPPYVTRLPLAIERSEPQLIILQFWGNKVSPCLSDAGSDEEYLERYFFDGLLAVQQIESSAQLVGIPRPKILWVLQGPQPGSEWLDRPRRLNEVYAFIAEIHGDRTSDAGWSVSEAARPSYEMPNGRYVWTQYLPCTEHEKKNGLCTHPNLNGGVTQLHRDDDPIHFCLGADYLGFCATPSPGAVRYGSRIAEDALGWLGL